MVSFVSALLYGVGGIVVAGMALLVAFQEKLVYVPVLPGLTKSYPITPARLRLLYEDVWLTSSDGVRLHAWFIKLSSDCKGPTILFFQENAGSIFFVVLFVGGYCYGASDGFPSQQGITKDAQAALNHLVERVDIDTSRIVVFGRSLGGAVGTVLVRNNPDKVAALILENTFTSILDMAGVLLPFLKWFIGKGGSKGPKVLNFLVRSPWSTVDVIGEVKQPILLLSGLQDEMVPPAHMEMLYAKAAARNQQCSFVEFPTGMHMDTWLAGGDRYWRTIQEFLEKTVPEKKDSGSSKVAFVRASATVSGHLSVRASGAAPPARRCALAAARCIEHRSAKKKKNTMNNIVPPMKPMSPRIPPPLLLDQLDQLETRNTMRDTRAHIELQEDLIKHIWAKFDHE
ncbi:hypothetical protein SASPL_126566 [Salvia splendens]|uniref:Peptidase S9 prolyl oligopeptidase catalytic domain-containing protein n=1 Tax=Salvia splendens TaxID=180675 RepID=A0A8X8XM38_SALSN|nr:hypothetical protein SASPL_126566 [Salvia splendens]